MKKRSAGFYFILAGILILVAYTALTIYQQDIKGLTLQPSSGSSDAGSTIFICDSSNLIESSVTLPPETKIFGERTEPFRSTSPPQSELLVACGPVLAKVTPQQFMEFVNSVKEKACAKARSQSKIKRIEDFECVPSIPVECSKDLSLYCQSKITLSRSAEQAMARKSEGWGWPFDYGAGFYEIVVKCGYTVEATATVLDTATCSKEANPTTDEIGPGPMITSGQAPESR